MVKNEGMMSDCQCLQLRNLTIVVQGLVGTKQGVNPCWCPDMFRKIVLVHSDAIKDLGVLGQIKF